jgi:hypothetical protein
MLADCPQHDDADAHVLVQRLEHEAQLVALGHLDDVERGPVEDHVSAFARCIDLDAEAVERGKPRIGEGHRCAHALGPDFWARSGGSRRYSPATSLRRSNLPTGDFGISATNS